MDLFSRNFKIEHYNNAVEIASSLGVKLPQVHAWEIYERSFTFPRIRHY